MPTRSEGFRRLHPASLLFTVGQVLRAFLLPAVLLLVFQQGEGFEGWLAILAVPAGVAAIVRYLSLRYALTQDELVIRRGILNRTERRVPFDHIHSLDTSRNVVHRLLGVADVMVQTASGSEPEAVLRVLSLDDVEAMRMRVFSDRRPGTRPTTDGDRSGDRASDAARDDTRLVAHASIGDLVTYGLISNRGTVALAAALGVVSQLDVLPAEDWWEQHARQLPGLAPQGAIATVVAVTAVVIGTIVVLRLLSVVWMLATLWDFRLEIRADELRTRYGLLTQRTVTLPRRRIQVVTSEQGWLHRLFHRTSMRARTAGAVAADRSGSSRDWLYPVARDEQVESLLTAAHPELDASRVDWQPVHSRAWRRLAVRWLLVIAAAAVAALATRPVVALALVPVAAASVWVARRRARSIRWGLTPTAIWYCHGWIGRHLRVVRFAKIQAVSLFENPFDRRHHMATVTVDTANAGPGGSAIRIPFLDRTLAERLRERLGSEASVTRFQW